MSLNNLALSRTDNLPIKHEGDVHSGKVRSVYWLSQEDSKRITKERGYPINKNSPLGVMVISDKISAFECNFKSEQGLDGVPGKGAALNQVSKYWFDQFDKEGLAGNHVLDTPHPLVWIVQRAKPIMIEAIARQYITGSMWRGYENGGREICGIPLPDGLEKNQELPELLITPSTKGILKGIPGVPEKDDVNVTRQQLLDNYQKFGFNFPKDIALYETLLRDGCQLARRKLKDIYEIFVDTKFEFGYVLTQDGTDVKMIYIDEGLTPDSSRFWDAIAYLKGIVIEKSKEGFRDFLRFRSGLEADILTNKERMEERVAMVQNYRVPLNEMMKVAETYRNIAEKITGKPVPKITDAKTEILDSLSSYRLVA